MIESGGCNSSNNGIPSVKPSTDSSDATCLTTQQECPAPVKGNGSMDPAAATENNVTVNTNRGKRLTARKRLGNTARRASAPSTLSSNETNPENPQGLEEQPAEARENHDGSDFYRISGTEGGQQLHEEETDDTEDDADISNDSEHEQVGEGANKQETSEQTGKQPCQNQSPDALEDHSLEIQAAAEHTNIEAAESSQHVCNQPITRREEDDNPDADGKFDDNQKMPEESHGTKCELDERTQDPSSPLAGEDCLNEAIDLTNDNMDGSEKVKVAEGDLQEPALAALTVGGKMVATPIRHRQQGTDAVGAHEAAIPYASPNSLRRGPLQLSPPGPSPLIQRSGNRAMGSDELEALRIEAKRREVQQMLERNARYVARTGAGRAPAGATGSGSVAVQCLTDREDFFLSSPSTHIGTDMAKQRRVPSPHRPRDRAASPSGRSPSRGRTQSPSRHDPGSTSNCTTSHTHSSHGAAAPRVPMAQPGSHIPAPRARSQNRPRQGTANEPVMKSSASSSRLKVPGFSGNAGTRVPKKGQSGRAGSAKRQPNSTFVKSTVA